MKHTYPRIIAPLALLALMGFGCEAPKEDRTGAQSSTTATAEVGTETPAPADGEPVVSEGKTYKDQIFGFQMTYPKDWYAGTFENVGEDGQKYTTTYFDDDPLPSSEPLEPHYPITLGVQSGNRIEVANEIAQSSDAKVNTDVQIGPNVVSRVIYHDDFDDSDEAVLVLQYGPAVLSFSVDANSSAELLANQMITSLK